MESLVSVVDPAIACVLAGRHICCYMSSMLLLPNCFLLLAVVPAVAVAPAIVSAVADIPAFASDSADESVLPLLTCL
jgi:hypothetical protein